MAKNISTKRGKGRIRVPPSQLTPSQRGRSTRLGEIFYMDKPKKPKVKDERFHSHVKTDTSSPFTDQETKRRRTTRKNVYKGTPKKDRGKQTTTTTDTITSTGKDDLKAKKYSSVGPVEQPDYSTSDRKQMDAIHKRLEKEKEQRRKAAEQADASQMEASKFKKIRKNPDFQPFKKGGKVIYKSTGGGMKYQLYGGSSKNIHDGNKEVAQFYDTTNKD